MYPIKVGLVGTGYAAKVRAESLQADSRSALVAVAGRTVEHTQGFSAAYRAEAEISWTDLIARADLDLVMIATINSEHGKVAEAALRAGKHVVVEYPLSLNLAEAIALQQLAQQQNRLLHVEHIEILSGIHQAVRSALPDISPVFYVRYTNLNAQRPTPDKWTYSLEQFGFPLVGALSRIHRLTNLFGRVRAVYCQAQYWQLDPTSGRYRACLCTTQLRFTSGLVAELVYGKGEAIWQSSRTLEIHGEQGGIFINGDQGMLIQEKQTRMLEMGSRRGLFAQDTARVLDHLVTGTPLYVSLADSLYALKVADAARQSAEIGQPIELSDG